MSAIHCKILDGRAIVRLSDCHGSIKWHNSINKPLEVKEMLSKLRNSIEELKQFEAHLVNLYLTL